MLVASLSLRWSAMALNLQVKIPFEFWVAPGTPRVFEDLFDWTAGTFGVTEWGVGEFLGVDGGLPLLLPKEGYDEVLDMLNEYGRHVEEGRSGPGYRERAVLTTLHRAYIERLMGIVVNYQIDLISPDGSALHDA